MFYQTQTARRPPKGPKTPFLSLVNLTFDLDLQTRPSKSPGAKTGVSALSAACVRFVFGKTYLASSLIVYFVVNISAKKYQNPLI